MLIGQFPDLHVSGIPLVDLSFAESILCESPAVDGTRRIALSLDRQAPFSRPMRRFAQQGPGTENTSADDPEIEMRSARFVLVYHESG